MFDQTAFDLTMDSINAVRTCIDAAIREGRVDAAWALSGKHALMVRAAAQMRAPVVAEAIRAEALVARAKQLSSPEEIAKGVALEQKRQATEAAEAEAYNRNIRDKAANQAAEKAAAEKVKLDEAQHAKMLADEELQAQQLAAEIADRVAKELAAGR